MDAASIQLGFNKQYAAVAQVPGNTLRMWPAFFTFAIVDTLASMVYSVVPNTGGLIGVVINAGLQGASSVIKFTTWDAVRGMGAAI